MKRSANQGKCKLVYDKIKHEIVTERPAITLEARQEMVEVMCLAHFPLSWKECSCDVERKYMNQILDALIKAGRIK